MSMMIDLNCDMGEGFGPWPMGDDEAMQLRYLNTVHDIAGERSSTIIFPVPIDLLRGFMASPAAERGASTERGGASSA